MAISHVATSSTVTANVASITTSLPAGVQSGDVLLLFVHDHVGTLTVTSEPAGWTFLRRTVDVNVTQDIWWKAASGSDTAPAVTYSGNSIRVGVISAYRGVNTSTPFVTENSVAETAAVATHSAPALTNTDAAAWGIFAAVVRGVVTPSSWTPGSGLVERVDVDTLQSGTWNLTVQVSDTNGPVATGSHTFSGTSSAAITAGDMWAGLLKPSAAVTTPSGSASGSWTFTGAASGVAPAAAPPAAPTGVTVTPADTTASVSWTPSSGATSYTVEWYLASEVKAGSASGSWNFTGAATGKAAPRGTASGAWNFTGAATGKAAPKGTAFGAWNFTGAATGKVAPKGTASGAWNFTGIASGGTTPRGTVSGSWGFAGAATGDAPGVPVTQGAAVGSWDFSGLAQGVTPLIGVRQGFAVGSWSFTGTAVGRVLRLGSATGSWVLLGEAAGVATPPTIVTVDYVDAVLIGNGVGQAVLQGTGVSQAILEVIIGSVELHVNKNAPVAVQRGSQRGS